MGRIARILLYSAGGIALVCGIAGIVYGTNNKVRTWVDDQIDQNGNTSSVADSSATSQSSNSGDSSGNGSSASTSSTPTSSTPVEKKDITIAVDQDNMVLDYIQTGVYPSVSVIATLGGNYGDNSTIVWESSDPSLLAFASLTTESGHAQTLVTKGAFGGTVAAYAHSAADYSVIATTRVQMYNHFTNLKMDAIFPLKSNGTDTLHKITVNGGSGSEIAAYDYNPGDGNYWHNDATTCNSTQSKLETDLENSLTSQNVINITASAGFKFRMEFVLWSASKDIAPGVCSHKWDITKPETFFNQKYTTTHMDFLYNTYKENYEDYWWIKFNFTVGANSTTGKMVFDFDGRYYCLNFNQYVPATSTTSSSASV